MDIRKLRHAIVLAEENNFARAATKLHITTSALSQSISRLEEYLELTLFDRDRSGVKLTGAGRQFMARIEPLMLEIRGVKHDLGLLRDGSLGDISFGIRPNAAKNILNKLLLDVAQKAPSIKIYAEISSNEDMLEHLLEERLEFAIFDSTALKPDKRLDVRLLLRIPVFFYVRRGHPLASRRRHTLSLLRKFPIAAAPASKVGHVKVMHWLGLSENDDNPITISCEDYDYLVDATLKGDLVLLAPHSAVIDEFTAGQLTRITPTDIKRQGFAGISLAFLKNRSMSPSALMIIGTLERLFKESNFSKL